MYSNHTVNEYKIIRIDSFKEAQKYHDYTNPKSRWCLTYSIQNYNGYTNYGKNTLDKLKEVITGKDVSKEVFKKKEQITTTRAYVEEVRGRRDISDSELLLKYRETFIKIDEMLLNELNECFSLLFS